MNSMTPQIETSVTAMEANVPVLRKMALELQMMGKQITTLSLLVHEKLAEELPRGTLNTICHEVAKMTGVPVQSMRGRSQNRKDVRARWYAIWLATELTDFKLVQIGGFFHRDHSSVINARDRLIERMDRDDEMRATGEILKQLLEVSLTHTPRGAS